MAPTPSDAVDQLVSALSRWPAKTPSAALCELTKALDGDLCSDRSLVARLRDGAISSMTFCDAAHAFLQRGAPSRRLRGAHPTPENLARWMAEAPRLGSGVVMDPACGCGHLLVAAAERNSQRKPDHWVGWDISNGCVQATKIALWLTNKRAGRPADFCRIRREDALFSKDRVKASLILANPPFMSIRQMAREQGAPYIHALRKQFKQLQGSFDLYVPFLLRIEDWLDSNGAFRFIVPATIWTAKYAAPVRSMFQNHLEKLFKVKGRGVFPGASVTTHIVWGQAKPPKQIPISTIGFERDGIVIEDNGRVARKNLPKMGFPTPSFFIRATSVRLGDVTDVSAGIPGYYASSIKDALLEASSSPSEPTLPFVTSRCIRRYSLQQSPIRFLRRKLDKPVIPISALTTGKRRLFCSEKIVIAGISKNIQAAHDTQGLALGVGVYAIKPLEIPPQLILAVLNSECISVWYRQRFLGRELSGGYFAVNCEQLRALPLPAEWIAGCGAADDVVDLVIRRLDNPEPDAAARLDQLIDDHVRQAIF